MLSQLFFDTIGFVNMFEHISFTTVCKFKGCFMITICIAAEPP